MQRSYDVIVVGGGHAGCEAAMAAARMGSSVLLISMDMNKFAQMSCNPAIGGIAKGQIVREIDALGGYTGIITDASTLQFRMLNRSKGPAMWSPRAQCDKIQFSLYWRKILESACKLDIYQDTVTSFLFSGSKITGVCTTTGAIFNSQAVILTAGTFLDGRMFIGRTTFDGGRIGELSSYGLTGQLVDMGIATARMKTGTPPRIDISSVDTSRMIHQWGDEAPDKFSYLPYLSSAQNGTPQLPCFVVHTNERVHDILRSGFADSPLFSGLITGIGPRYCPSIEDKLRTFAGKTEHQLFLEPEGRGTNEYYLQGFSSSLPLDVQMEALHAIDLLANAAATGLGLDGLDLFHIVSHEVANAVVHAVGDVGVSLVVAVEVSAGQVVTGLNGGVHLTGGHHVDAHVLLAHDLIDALEAVGLGGIQGTGVLAEMLLESRGVNAAALADLILVHQVQGGAVLLGQLHGILTGKVQMAVLANGDVIANHGMFLLSRIFVWKEHAVWRRLRMLEVKGVLRNIPKFFFFLVPISFLRGGGDRGSTTPRSPACKSLYMRVGIR